MSDVKNKTVNIYIDQAAAQTALEKLQVAADKLNKKIDEGRLAGKAMVAEIKKLAETQDAIKGVQAQIDNGLRPSFVQTQNQVTKLRNELKHMSEDAPGYAEKFQAFQKARAELDRLSTSINGVEKAQKSWLQEAKVVAFGVLIGNTVQSAIGAIGGYFSGIISGNAKMSDSLADVEKATGLSAKSVGALNKELGQIDTRTAAADLREIAVGLGQIGQEANKANVEAIDKIVVALGDEFGGGAKEITTTLSVLRNNLKDIKTGNYAEDVTHIGNALNVLGAEGLATAPVVTDIANRIAGIAQTYKLTSGQILGVAATFQELGIETERGSTALTKIFQKIGAEPEKFAKVAGLSIEKFKNLVNKDMLGAFTAVAEGAKKAGGNNIIFSKILNELGADGAGAGEVLSKLGANADLLTNKIKTSSLALKDSSSITDEFNKKNTTLGAQLEKLNKVLSSFIQSKTLTDVFAAGVRGIIAFVGALRAVPQWLQENHTGIYLIVTGLLVMNAAYIKAGALIVRDTALRAINAATTYLSAAAANVATASQAAYIVVTNLLTSRITIATAAQRLWNIAMTIGAGPIGVIIVAVGALVIGMDKLFGATSQVTEQMKIQNEVNKNVAEQIGSQKDRMNELLSVARDVNQTDEIRKKALDGFIAQSPQYLQGLTLENINRREGVAIINDYINALDRMAEAKALRSIKEDAAKQSLTQGIDLKGLKEDAENEGLFSQAIGSVTGTGANQKYTKKLEEHLTTSRRLNTATDEISSKISKLNFTISVQQQKLKALTKGTDEYARAQRDLNESLKERNQYLGLSSENAPASISTATAIDPFGDKNATKKAKIENDERAKLIKELEDFQFELSQVGKQADESEIDRISKKYDALIKRAAKYGLDYINLEKEKNRTIAYLLDQEERKRAAAIKKINLAAAEESYRNFQNTAVDEGEDKKDVAQKKYADGILNKRELAEAIKRIDIETLQFEIGIAQNFAGASKQAAEDLVKLKKKLNKEELADLVATREHKIELEKREALAAAEVAVLKTREGSKARLDAQLNQLKVEYDNELKNTELTNSQKEKLDIEYRRKVALSTIEFYAQQIEQTLGFINSGLDIISKFNDAKNAKENAALQKELKNNEARKNSIRSLENSKVISIQESRRRVTNIEKEEDAKKAALEKKQGERQKKFALAHAVINGALAVTKILAETPKWDFGVATAIEIGLAVTTTAAEVIAIAGQKFAEGGQVQNLRNGKVNTRRNIPTQPNGDDVLATVKVGEVLLNEQQQQALGGPDTFRSIGVPGFGTGGTVRPFWEKRPYRSINYPSVASSMQAVKFAQGGLVQAQKGNADPMQNIAGPLLDTLQKNQEALQQSQEVNVALMSTVNSLTARLAAGIDANISLKRFDNARAQQDRIKKDAELK